MVRDTYERSAEIEREVGRCAYESAKGDALGVPDCAECGVRKQHNAHSDYCLRCESEIEN